MAISSKIGLITCVTSQKVSTIGESFLDKQCIVYGIKSHESSYNTKKAVQIDQNFLINNARLEMHYGDLSEKNTLIRLTQKNQPGKIHSFDAKSHVAVPFESLRIHRSLRCELGLASEITVQEICEADLFESNQHILLKAMGIPSA